MARQEYTKHQQSIINRYYNNLDTIMLQKLQELVTELYLADSESAKARLWDRVQKAMVKLKIPGDQIAKIMQKRSPEALATQLQQWLKK